MQQISLTGTCADAEERLKKTVFKKNTSNIRMYLFFILPSIGNKSKLVFGLVLFLTHVAEIRNLATCSLLFCYHIINLQGSGEALLIKDVVAVSLSTKVFTDTPFIFQVKL